jgi:hypothetical protein
MAPEPEFKPEDFTRLLGRHRVNYVLIGGLAAVVQGAPLVTQDIDICYAREPENLERLAAALHEIHAELRGADPRLPFLLDAKTLARGDAFTLTTDLGWIDIIATPAGTSGYDDLARTADEHTLYGQRVLIAAIDDLIRMKLAAGRRKDLLAAEELGALREEVDRLANRGGRPAAKRAPVESSRTRKFGSDRGVLDVPDDFDASLPDDISGEFES